MRSVAAAICCMALAAPAAQAADPGRWIVTGTKSVPSRYRQGIASDSARNVFFAGATVGLYRTNNGRQTARNGNVIPPDVAQREQYNHIGDIAWDSGGDGRLLLPLESYIFGRPDPNPAKTGSFGVVDPKTMKWRYYVKLDPAEIPKAMWVATSPDGLAWTSSGDDLLAYNLADITLANAAPNGAVLHAVKRLAGAVPPGGVSGAAVYANRLYISGGEGPTQTIHSVDLSTGSARLEYERAVNQEPEGVDAGPYSGGFLHWGLANTLEGFAGTVVHLLAKGSPIGFDLSTGAVRAGRRSAVGGEVFAMVGRTRIHVPLGGVRVRLGNASAVSDSNGHVSFTVTLARGGYRATASYKGLRTGVAKLRAI
jgi:hypothetical protein